jgi:hypothetical protein
MAEGEELGSNLLSYSIAVQRAWAGKVPKEAGP